MLEGQVAVLSAGHFTAQECLDVLNALRSGNLYRQDQNSYLLYPDRQLPRFVDKNTIPPAKVKESKLLAKLLACQDASIIRRDNAGNVHFNANFRNAAILEEAINQLDPVEFSSLVTEEKAMILALFEETFDHHSFTGRSGTFYGYEGLGSIYWHMVSKLMLAAQECYFRGLRAGENPAILGGIKDHYHEIKEGIGLFKSPLLYGAFPTDPYSHTPGMAGAQQPGMTGQVKEDFLSRMRELGIHIHNGEITFQTALLDPTEFLKQDRIFEYFDLLGDLCQVTLKAGQLCFTFCQVPIIYTGSGERKIGITFNDGTEESYPGNIINKELSAKIFSRTGEITRVVLFTGNLNQ
jgi:hypothetical protein